MARLPLSKLEGWRLADPALDPRGLELQDASGRKLGIIADLLVNTQSEVVDGLLLDTFQELKLRPVRRSGSILTLSR